MSNNNYKKYGGQVSERKNVIKKKNKLNKSEVIVFILMVIWSISAVLGSLSFFGVKADTVDENTTYVYDGNNFFVPSSTQLFGGIVQPLNSPFSLSVDVKLSTIDVLTFDKGLSTEKNYYNVPTISLSVYTTSRNKQLFVNSNDTPTGGISPNAYSFVDGYYFLDKPTIGSNPSRASKSFFFYYEDYSTSGYTGLYGAGSYRADIDFNCNVVSVRYYSETSDYIYNTPDDIPCMQVYNRIDYTDNNGKVLTLSFKAILNKSSFYTGLVAWEDRTYYLSTNFDDNEYYKNGYDAGYLEGKNAYNGSGYQDGYNAGKEAGYNQGKNDGIASANDYSWIGLIGAVVDVPLQAFSSLFNFNILGINMLGFVSSIFTILILIVVVKLCLGGGF